MRGDYQPGQDGGGVTLEQVEDRPQTDFTNAVFEQYTPKKLKISGAKPHNTPLVESSALATVSPPNPTYTPNLPKALIESGALSDAQLEVVVYAGQAHEQFLENEQRRGFFVGDGTGVGKGREISGIIMDNLRQGRKKAVWISQKKELMEDAKRDFGDIGGDPKIIFGQHKMKGDAKIDQADGILFSTYSLIKGDTKATKTAQKAANVMTKMGGVAAKIGKAMKAGQLRDRTKQIVNWLGEDFDGVIVFDEAHNMGNAVAMKGERGNKEPSEQALAAVALQNALPKARIVYVSATGATEVSNLAYATRLGLWGAGTPFANDGAFVSAMSTSVSAMELVAQNLKQMGLYFSRSLSFDGGTPETRVTYDRLEHALDPYQRDVYNALSTAWQTVLNNIDKALDMTGVNDNGKPAAGGASGKKKGAILSAFWGSHQRFFNQVITALQMPSVIAAVKQDLAAGNAVVMQIVNTNEADQNRALAKLGGQTVAADDGETTEIEELDLTPREQLITFLEKAFPVQKMEVIQTTNPDGSVTKSLNPVVDSEGKPVFDADAMALRQETIDMVRQITIPDAPLQMVINEFGPDRVAEITGRGERVIYDENGKLKTEKRGAHAAANDAQAFKDGKKDILIFSNAGGTGFSFHADRRYKNQKRRKHYVIQPGWSADKAIQGLGRSHRTNQKTAPQYVLVTTDVPAQKRFISTIARRLESMGALTMGQRDTAGGTMFKASDNLESKYATRAVEQFFDNLIASRYAELPAFMEVLKQMGLEKAFDPQTRGANKDGIPPVRQFLNRMLSVSLEMQETIMTLFAEEIESQVELAKSMGAFDDGLKTVHHVGATVKREEVINQDERSGAETMFYEIDYKTPNDFYDFDKADREIKAATKGGWFKNKKSGHVIGLLARNTTRTDKYGQVHRLFGVRRTSGNTSMIEPEIKYDTLEKLKTDEARALWEAENEKRSETVDNKLNMVVGAILPLWDRFTGEHVNVSRIRLDDGRKLLGRVILPKDVEATLANLNIKTAEALMTGSDLVRAVLDGQKVVFSNQWTAIPVTVSNEKRIEITGAWGRMPNFIPGEAQDIGIIQERIGWQERYFIPSDVDRGGKVLDTLMRKKSFNATKVGKDDDGAKFSRRIHGDNPNAHDYIVPETPEFADNMSGDLSYTPQSAEANGLEQLPIRLTVGVAREAHRGFGIMHMADNAKRDISRRPPQVTDDDAENFARQVAAVARTFQSVHHEHGNRYILISPKATDALVVERITDAFTGEDFYSAVTLVPVKNRHKWGKPVWAGRADFPVDRALQSRASVPSPDQESQRSDRQPQRSQTSHFDFTQVDPDRQPKKSPTVTVKKRRSFTMDEVKKSATQSSVTDPHTLQSFKSAIDAAEGKGFADRLEETGNVAFITSEELPETLTGGDTQYSLSSEYEVQPDTTPDSAINGAKLTALRRAAAGIESPERGITFRVDEEGRAIVTGPARAKVPSRFQRFANEHGLTLVVRRGPTVGSRGSVMPITSREAGALYFGEIANGPGEGGAWLDRTGKARFSRRKPDTINVDGVDRPTTNSNGQPIAASEEGLRNFWRWFGDSQVVDNEGRPRVVYHGSPVGDLTEFDPKKSRDIGIHFSESDLSAKFGGNKYEVYLKIENLAEASDIFSIDGGDIGVYSKRVPGAIDVALGLMSSDAVELMALGYKVEKNWDESRDADNTKKPTYRKFWKRVLDLARQEGVDGFEYENLYEGGGKSYVVFDPTQIKSATGNRGTFDPTNQDIRYSKDGRILAFYKDGKVHFVTDNISQTKDSVPGLLRHEIAVHALRLNRSDKEFQAILRELRLLRDSGNVKVKAAYAAVPKDTAASLVDEEALGYLTEKNPEQSLAKRFIAWLRNVLRKLAGDWANTLTVDDLVWMAGKALRTAPERMSGAEDNADTRYSKTIKSDIGNIIENPTRDQAENLLRRARYGAMRGLRDPDTGRLYIWDAADAIHHQVAREIGITEDVYERLEFGDVDTLPSGVFSGEPGYGRVIADRAGAYDVVMYSRRLDDTSPSGPVWDAPVTSTGWENIVYELQDKHIDTKRVVEAIKQSGEYIDPEWNPHLQEQLFHGRSAKGVDDFLNDELRPLVEAMAKAGVNQEDLNAYLHARHAKERNEAMKDINEDREDNDGLSGLTDEEADAVLESFSDRADTMEDLANYVDRMISGTRRMLVGYGLETQETVSGWAEKYEHYVPLHREGFPQTPGTGQGYSIRGKFSKLATGSRLPVDNILAHVAMQRERAIVRGEKNRVAMALYSLALLNPNKAFWSVDKVAEEVVTDPDTGLPIVMAGDIGDIKVPRIKAIDKATGQVTYYPDPTYKGRGNVVVTRINGKDYAVIFNERNERAMRMAESLKNLDVDQMHDWLGKFGAVTRYFASINTQYNPVFGLWNLMRDAPMAAINLSSTPIADKRLDVMHNTSKALAGIYQDARAVRKGKKPSSAWADLWEQFQQDGGQTGYRDLFRTSKDRANAIQHMLDPDWWQKTWPGKVATAGWLLAVPEKVLVDKAGRAMFDWLSDFNLTMENAIRLAAYKVALDEGMDRQDAAALAKNLTVNFNKKGRSSTTLGALFAFFNASVQGTARIAETIYQDGKMTNAGQAIVLGGITLGAMQALALALAGFDEDEPPEWIKERSLVIPVPGAEKGYVAYPYPLGYHVLPNLGRHLMEYMLSGFEDPGKRVVNLIATVMNAFNPLGSATVAQMATPTVFDPLVALAENQDFTGKPIYREDMSSLRPTPGESRAKDSATFIGRGVAIAANRVTGGTEYTPGWVSPTPDQIDYLLGQLTGGVGREAGKLEQTVTGLVTGDLAPMYKVPILGRMAGSASSESAHRDRFYRNLTELNTLHAELKGRREERQNTIEFRREHPELRMLGDAAEIQAQMRIYKKSGKRYDERLAKRIERFNQKYAELQDR